MESSEPATLPGAGLSGPRLRAAGKFLFEGNQKVYLGGVTLWSVPAGSEWLRVPQRSHAGGPFRPDGRVRD